MSLITVAEAARRLGKHKTAIAKWKKKPADKVPEFFVYNENGKLRIDTDHPEWQMRETKEKAKPKNEVRQRQLSDAGKKGAGIKHEKENSERPKKKVEKDPAKEPEETVSASVESEQQEAEPEEDNDDIVIKMPKKPKMQVLPAGAESIDENDEEYKGTLKKFKLASLKKEIFSAEIKEQQADQERLKTLEKKKEVAPIDLILHFFSFSENLIQRLYRRPHEISPQLESLYIGKEPKKAVQLIIRELESIVKDCQQELRQSIKEEGYKVNVKD